MVRTLAVLLSLALGAITLPASAQEMSPEYKRNYDRILDFPDKVMDIGPFEPTEKVVGAPGAALPRAELSLLDGDALAPAVEQARKAYTMAFLVYADGAIQFEDYRPGFTAKTRFNSYSSHKGLVATATMVAVDQGFMKLTDLASDFIPEWAQDERRAITVGDLLWMQSGLAIPQYKQEPGNPVLEMFIGTDISPAMRAIPLAKTPGEEFEFNHLNSQALHDVIVAASGLRYADFLSRYIWQPLELDDSWVALDHPQGTARSVCCFINSPSNWIRIGAMLANGGSFNGTRILSAESAKLLGEPSPLNPSFGMFMQRAAPGSGYLADDLYFFEGQGGQRLYVVPSLKLTFYRTGRTDYRWDDVHFANSVIDAYRKGR